MVNKFFIYFTLLLFILLCVNTSAQQQTEKQMYSAAAALSVTIGGDFIVTGTFPAMVNERVDQFVTRISVEAMRADAMRPLTASEMKGNKVKENKFALRNITLKRSDGSKLILDLQRFRMDGDFKNNPYMKNDDVLIFPVLDLERDNFSIDGAVNKPGRYQFVEGDNLQDAIYYSGGMSRAFENVTQSEIYRLSSDGTKLDKIVVDVNSDFPLKRGDRIRVGTEVSYRKDYKILVLGEVRFPGYVPVSRTSSNLADVIKTAGGLTEKADPSNTKIFRSSSLPPDYFKKLYGSDYEDDKPVDETADEFFNYLLEVDRLEMNRMSGLTEVDTAYFFAETRLKNLIDYDRVNLSGYEASDSDARQRELKLGDIIFVGQKETSVYVFGQVRYPGNYKHAAGKDYNYYISTSGGLGEYAIDDEIWLIKNVTREWVNLAEKSAVIEPGDVIFVQREPVYSYNCRVLVC